MESNHELNQEIEAKKVTLNSLFKDYWFQIPEYQRSYVWGKEQIDELLDDLAYARNSNPNKEYFLGSVVLQMHMVKSNSLNYEVCDVLDGQQRMTTLFLLMAVLRDLSEHDKLITNAKEAIFQEEDPFSNQPERIRVEFMIRDMVEGFVDEFIKEDRGTLQTEALKEYLESPNISLRNMASALLYLREELGTYTADELNDFAIFLFNKVVVIYVASGSLDDAFRLFTILNDRGMPLSSSDIIKSMNIGKVDSDKKRQHFAQAWERMEGEFGREGFDRFLGHIRTIIIKEKSRENLLKEYEKIYQKNLLSKGQETLTIIESYRDIYAKLIWFDDQAPPSNYKLQNLITIMKIGLSTDWIPVFMAYYRKHRDKMLFQFLQKLESKISADQILQETPTKRLAATYQILRLIEKSKSPEQVINNDECYNYDRQELKARLSGDIYRKNFSRYVLLKIEYLLLDDSQQLADFNRVSVEHVLPRNPKENSTWFNNFSEDERLDWNNKIANLVLLSRIKNAQLNNSDFDIKKKRYFSTSTNVFPNINRVMQFNEWTVDVLQKRQEWLIQLLMKGYK